MKKHDYKFLKWPCSSVMGILLYLLCAHVSHAYVLSVEAFHSPPVSVDAEITVSGKVTSSVDNSALPGVTVLIQGTFTGSVTDIDGNYTVTVPNGEDILVFSSIGYISQAIPVDGRSEINVVLMQDTQNLDEVVVVGYGTQSQREVTGSIATLDARQLEDQPVGRS